MNNGSRRATEMSQPKRVGLTGSVASGKSTALKFFADYGAFTFSADSCLHQAYESDGELIAQIAKVFGEDILSDGKINRDKLAHTVFSSAEALSELESLTHPYVFAKMTQSYKNTIAACLGNTSALFVAEIPLLFESKAPFSSWFDSTVCVIRNRQEAKKSFAASKKMKEGDAFSQFDLRMARFIPDENTCSQCTYTLKNFGSLESLNEQVGALYKTLTSNEV